MRALPSLPLVLLALSLQGCLPYACNRMESRVLSPEDSLSRAFADAIPVDTLVPTGVLAGPFEYPRTVGFAPDGTLYVTDAGAHRLHRVDPDGAERILALDTLRYPYLAGFVGPSPAVYSPDAHVLFFVQPLHPTGELMISAWWHVPDEGPERDGLRYATVSAGEEHAGIWLKVLGPDYPGFLGRVDSTETFVERIPLPGPYWRHAGLLRTWMDVPLSLSGYLPLVHRIRDGRLDSLALFGFDSPMLARTRQYLRGDVDAPPLLTAAAAPVDSMLYVLNMRPGWLRVDVFDRHGRLRQVLVEPDPGFNKDFYPTDLAVRRTQAGIEMAVAVVEPQPEVRRYIWPRP